MALSRRQDSVSPRQRHRRLCQAALVVVSLWIQQTSGAATASQAGGNTLSAVGGVNPKLVEVPRTQDTKERGASISDRGHGERHRRRALRGADHYSSGDRLHSRHSSGRSSILQEIRDGVKVEADRRASGEQVNELHEKRPYPDFTDQENEARVAKEEMKGKEDLLLVEADTLRKVNDESGGRIPSSWLSLPARVRRREELIRPFFMEAGLMSTAVNGGLDLSAYEPIGDAPEESNREGTAVRNENLGPADVLRPHFKTQPGRNRYPKTDSSGKQIVGGFVASESTTQDAPIPLDQVGEHADGVPDNGKGLSTVGMILEGRWRRRTAEDGEAKEAETANVNDDDSEDDGFGSVGLLALSVCFGLFFCVLEVAKCYCIFECRQRRRFQQRRARRAGENGQSDQGRMPVAVSRPAAPPAPDAGAKGGWVEVVIDGVPVGIDMSADEKAKNMPSARGYAVADASHAMQEAVELAQRLPQSRAGFNLPPAHGGMPPPRASPTNTAASSTVVPSPSHRVSTTAPTTDLGGVTT